MDLRPGADDCYKYSTIDTNCPVAAVDDDFPGPKFQGPEQWRLTRSDEDHEIDDSIMQCSNCMQCDSSCPSGVPLSQMHNAARARYVDEQQSTFSIAYWRNRILANYRTFAKLGSLTPRFANTVLNNSLVQAVELFGDLEGVAVTDVGKSCSGISGTYGWKAEKYDVSMDIGEEMFEHMEDAPAETGLTECPTCAMQMEHGTGYEIRHPLEVLESALVEGAE